MRSRCGNGEPRQRRNGGGKSSKCDAATTSGGEGNTMTPDILSSGPIHHIGNFASMITCKNQTPKLLYQFIKDKDEKTWF